MKKGTRRVTRLVKGGRAVSLLLRKGHIAHREQRPLVPPQIQHEIVDDTENRWLEVWFESFVELDGNAAEGWTMGGLFFRLERSEDLMSWDHEWEDAPGSPSEADGVWTYRARAKFPVNSVEKTGQLSLRLDAPDPRMNPVTTVTLGGVDLDLPNYPYQLPADAAALEADLIADGWTGATVEATGADGRWLFLGDFATRLRANPIHAVVVNLGTHFETLALPNYPYSLPADEALLITDVEGLGWTGVSVVEVEGWEIEIPNVPHEGGYLVSSRVSWPVFYMPDRYGALTMANGGLPFTGTYVNGDGVRTGVPRQFARMRYGRGTP